MKKSIIEHLRSLGASAAYNADQKVDMVRGKPKHAVLASPLFMDKKKLKSGDKIAFVDTREGVAFVCRITKIDYSLFSSRAETDLSNVKTVDLS